MTDSELPVTEVFSAAPANVPEPSSYPPPLQFRSVTPPAETEPLVLDDLSPVAAAEGVNTTFLSPSGLEVLGVREPQDVVRYAANQSATDSGSRSFGDVYSVRGLTNTVFFGAPSTTVYVDDVPFGETFTYAQELGPINSVEVLRGPQPTLAGRNVYGGLINVQTRRPGDTLEGGLDYQYGSFDRHGVNGWITSPLGESVSFRLNGGYNTHEGYLTNPSTGEKVDRQESFHFGGAVYLDVAPGWEVGVIAGYSEQNDGAPRLTSLDRTTGFYTVSSEIAGEQHRESDYQAIRIAHENERFRFLSVTSHRGFDLDPYTIDLDFSALPFGFTTLSQSQELWSQEFRFSDNDPDAEWGWNAGVYGSVSRIEGVGLRGLSVPNSDTQNTVTQVNQEIFPGFSIPLTIRSVSQLETVAELRQLTEHTIDENSFAVYGGLENRALDDITFRAGARLDWIRRSLIRDKSQTGEATTVATTTSTIDPVMGFPPFPAPPVDVRTIVTPLDAAQRRIAMQDEWVHVTPNFGVDWEATDDDLVYANTAYAFKPGGFSAYADNPAFVPFDEETAWTTELGVRSSHLGGRVNTNLVGFYSRVDDYQVERSFTATDFAVFNAEEAEIYGAEFETTVEITPTLDFLGSIGYTHATLTSYIDPVTGTDLSGVTAPFVPEFDAVAALDYHLDNGFFARVELVALGNVKFDDFNRDTFQESAFVLVNSSVGYRKDRWSVALYGSNLADKEYYTNMNAEIRTGAVGIPREYGVRIGMEF
jgi:iron complex outermembrane receptor protein